jgi:hypothetical protein
LLLVSSILRALPAHADGGSTLELERAAGTESCPDAAELVNRVAELEPSARLRTGAPVTGSAHFRIEIERRPEHWRARILVGGTKSGDRTLTDSGESCAGLVDAVALTLAILIAPDDEPQADPAEPARPAQLPPRPVPAPISARPAPKSGGLELALRAGPALTLGLLERPGVALFGEIELGVTPAFRTGLGGLWAPPQSIDHGPGRVEVSLVALTLSACLGIVNAGWLDAELCVTQAAGQIHGRGRDYSAYTDSARRPWLAVGGGPHASGPILGPLGWTAMLVALAPLTDERFAVEGVSGLAFEPSPVALVAQAGFRLSIE